MPKSPRQWRKYGPEYGLEAIRRLEAGYSIVYNDDDTLLAGLTFDAAGSVTADC